MELDVDYGESFGAIDGFIPTETTQAIPPTPWERAMQRRTVMFGRADAERMRGLVSLLVSWGHAAFTLYALPTEEGDVVAAGLAGADAPRMETLLGDDGIAITLDFYADGDRAVVAIHAATDITDALDSAVRSVAEAIAAYERQVPRIADATEYTRALNSLIGIDA
jgi:hypothetical protein